MQRYKIDWHPKKGASSFIVLEFTFQRKTIFPSNLTVPVSYNISVSLFAKASMHAQYRTF